MPHPTRQAIVRWAASVLLTVVAYFASTGPAMFLAVNGYLSPKMTHFIFNVFFYPLHSLCARSEWMHTLVSDWADRWTVVMP